MRSVSAITLDSAFKWSWRACVAEVNDSVLGLTEQWSLSSPFIHSAELDELREGFSYVWTD